VSTDDHETQCNFARSLDVPFPMVGDAGRAVSKALGVLWPVLGVNRRVTFVADKEGIVRGVFRHEFQIGKHLDDARALLEKLHRAEA
jgi:thioredoxin-dependent peroxiredoxin